MSREEYEKYFKPFHIFNSTEFNELTAKLRNTDAIHLGFKTSKYKLGIIGGIVNNSFVSPFSAPFGGFNYGKEDVSLEQIDSSIELLKNYCIGRGLSSIKIILPPLIYDPSFISRTSNSLHRNKFALSLNELNYSIGNLGSIEEYEGTLQRNARKNLAIAKSRTYSLMKCDCLNDKVLAYEIIKENRNSKGYNLALTKDDVLQTINVIDSDIFLLKLDNDFVASAIIFRVSPHIVQVVYWGDLPQYSLDKPINYLAYTLVKHYLNEGIKHIDIGPATIDGTPNYGLCNFKESIGCEAYPKYTYTYNI